MLFATMNVKPTTTTAALSLSLSHTKSEKKAVGEILEFLWRRKLIEIFDKKPYCVPLDSKKNSSDPAAISLQHHRFLIPF